jgi:hypothetical protein
VLAGQTLTLDSLVARASTGSIHVGRDTTVILDEAGMTDHKRLDGLAALVERSGAKLIAVGDGKQLPSIGPGLGRLGLCSAFAACTADAFSQASCPVDVDRLAVGADERDVDPESHGVGDVGQLAEREVATAGFDGGDVGGGDSEALGDLGLREPERLAGVFELAADDLRVDLGYRRSASSRSSA